MRTILVCITSLLICLLSLTAISAENSEQQPTQITEQFSTLEELSEDTDYSSTLLSTTQEYSAKCCKICKKGKACGNSCISRAKNCKKGKGCACDG